MTKVAVCGKGGSGKSITVALLARVWQDKGYRVLVVDSDESNPGVYRALGFDRRPKPLLELVGGKKQVFPAFSEEAASPGSLLTQDAFRIADLPGDYVVERDGVGLVCVGKILQSLEGCACPMGVLSREFLKRLALQEDERVIVDTEAGIEHFGRGVETSIDSVLVVTEPSFDSLELAAKISDLAAEVGVAPVWTVLNKVSSKEIAAQLQQEMAKRGISVIGSIGYEPEIFQAGLEGRPVRRDRLETDIESVLGQL
ncbi:MAG: ATP-binding protein [Anaerolineae bacterium]|nr:ATP-binding protein [Anaerolineae bacterium]